MGGVIIKKDHVENLDKVYPWMRVVSIRNNIPASTVLRVWQLHAGQIRNLKSKPGTKAAEFVTPGGIMTQKGLMLVKELDMERDNYIAQTGRGKMA